MIKVKKLENRSPILNQVQYEIRDIKAVLEALNKMVQDAIVVNNPVISYTVSDLIDNIIKREPQERIILNEDTLKNLNREWKRIQEKK